MRLHEELDATESDLATVHTELAAANAERSAAAARVANRIRELSWRVVISGN